MNQRGITSKIMYCILVSFYVFIVYNSSIFVCLPQISYETSRSLLFFLTFASMGAAIVLETVSQKSKNNYLFVCLTISYSLYFVLSRSFIQGRAIFLTFMIVTSTGSILAIIVIARKIKSKDDSKRQIIIKRRIKRSICLYVEIFSIGFAILILGTIGKVLMDNEDYIIKAMSNAKSTELVDAKNTQSIIEYEIPECLYDVNWPQASLQEKISSMQTIVEIEKKYLGIPTEIQIKVKGVNRSQGMLGGYLDERSEIELNYNYLIGNRTCDQALATVLHEAYHAYERMLVLEYEDSYNQQLLIYEDAKKYKEEFENYVSGFKDFDKYESQRCEVDARSYSEQRLSSYISEIRKNP